MDDLNALALRCSDLERLNAQLTRINQTLMDRIERSIDQQGSSFSLFQAAIALEAKVKERTAALSRALATLEHTNRELQASNEAALAASRAKSTFLATMSHELRTPMNGVVGMTELLMTTSLDASQHESVEIIQESAQSLLRILNDILDFSKIEAGFLVTESLPFDLRRSVDQVIQLMRPRIEAKKLSLTTSWDDALPRAVIGDSMRLAQIVTNLLGNAVKFTAEGSIAVRAMLSADLGSSMLCRFEIQDTGIGVRPESLPLLFESFTQSDSSITREFGGTGLGLAIVRRLCQLMGGDCGVTSEYGTGATFWFTVKLEHDMSHVPRTNAASLTDARESQKPHPAPMALEVLVAEDNQVNQLVICGFLKSIGCRSTVTENGADAVALLAAPHRFDLVLMDCQMPEMDGFEATRRIRSHERVTAARIPIIALTANAMVGDREACLASGMDDFLSKPLRLAELRTVLERWGRPATAASTANGAQSSDHPDGLQGVARVSAVRGAHRAPTGSPAPASPAPPATPSSRTPP